MDLDFKNTEDMSEMKEKYFDVGKIKRFFIGWYNKDTYTLKTDIIENGGACHAKIVLKDDNGIETTICECNMGKSGDWNEEELVEYAMRFMFDDLLRKAYDGRLVKELSE